MGRRILAIADADRGRALRGALSPHGHEVDFYADCREALGRALEVPFDMVLLADAASAVETAAALRQLKAAGVAAPVVVLSGDTRIEAAVAAMRQGAADYLRWPCDDGSLLDAVNRLERGETEADGGLGVEPLGQSPEGFEGMLGCCPAMREVFALVRRIAPADSTVLVTGESGTGKEMVVRAIHCHSRRRDYPLLACDCTALAPTLLESELFGHVKGSFSGAIATKKGLFEVAHQGTLMLDEVANLSQETQGKLLRVLEARRVRKVGDTVEQEVDIRLIATTNRSLAEMVKVGQFRADLYYRLNVVPVALPPLRDRGNDLALLAKVFLERFSRQMGVPSKGLSSEALRQMQAYAWPGNVRELRNIVERLAVLYGGTCIEATHLPPEVREAKAIVNPCEVPALWDEVKRLKRRFSDDVERRFILAALDRCGQNVTQAAESVGMQRTNFHALMRQHGLRPEGPRDS